MNKIEKRKKQQEYENKGKLAEKAFYEIGLKNGASLKYIAQIQGVKVADIKKLLAE